MGLMHPLPRRMTESNQRRAGLEPQLLRQIAAVVEDLPLPDRGALPPARPGSGYDRLIDALNRLPRPFMAIGTQILVIYALLDPSGFAARMEGLDAMPEAMWWLLGAVITAYFGAREAHHMRNRPKVEALPAQPPPTVERQGQVPAPISKGAAGREASDARPVPPLRSGQEGNAALEDWRAGR